jgi:ATP-binding cassette subfamily B multidrug efflux pump
MTNQSPEQRRTEPRVGIRRGRGPGNPGVIEKARNPQEALQRLIPYLRPYTGALILVSLFVLSHTVLGLLGPYLIGITIDDYILRADIPGTIRMAVLMLVVYLSGAGFQAVSEWMMARVSQGVLKTMRRDLFEHLQSLSLRFFDQNPAGELMSRLTNDIDAINQAVSQNLVSIIASLLTLVGILIAMFVLNYWLALSSILVVPILFWFTGFVAKYTRRGFRRLQKELGRLNATMEETISGQRVVKAFRRNDTAIDTFRENNKAVYDAGLYANSYALLLMPLTNVLGNFFVIVLAGLGAWLTIQGLATVGIIAAFISYGRRFIQPLRQLANMYNSIQAALAGAERVFEIIDTKPELVDAPGAISVDKLIGDVHFENVHFGYLKDVPVIKNMSLKADPGETVALVGPTGAGKTTLVNLLTRFYDIQGGHIKIDGTDIRQMKMGGLRRQAVRTGQQPQPGTAPAFDHRPCHPGRSQYPDPG